jgi:hypothetical protein
MRNRNAFTPDSAHALETRAVPSLTLSASLLPTADVAVAATSVMHLAGTVQGIQTPAPHLPGTAHLSGGGTVGPLGNVKITGVISVRSAEPTFYNGAATLSNARGSVTIRISGIHGGPDFLGRPVFLHYTITGGTGAFRGAVGSGTVGYLTLPAPTANPVDGQMVFRLSF